MPYKSEPITIPAFIADVATQLVSHTDVWEMVDADLPNRGRCLKFIPDDVFVGIQIAFSAEASRIGNSSYHAAGISITFAETYDMVTKAFGGTIRRGIVHLFHTSDQSFDMTSHTTPHLGDVTAYDIAYTVDRDGVIACIRNPVASTTHGNVVPRGVFFGLECPPSTAFEYSDGHGRLVFYSLPHVIDSWYIDPTQDENFANLHFMNVRPMGRQTNFAIIDDVSKGAVRGLGNSKSYFVHPQVHGVPTTLRDPLLVPRKWFRVDPNSGLAVGDAITWEDGNVTRKYRVSEATNQGSPITKLYAIAYENVPMYP